MKNTFVALALVSALAVSGCAASGEQNTWGMGNKQTMGTLGGAAIGGILGSNIGGGKGKTAATIGGALLGAYAGSSIGKSLDQSDMMYHQQAVSRAYNAPLNQTINWNNPETGRSGSVTPIREGRQASTGSLCREYKQTIYIDGRAETAVGTACKNSDGTWTVTN